MSSELRRGCSGKNKYERKFTARAIVINGQGRKKIRRLMNTAMGRPTERIYIASLRSSSMLASTLCRRRKQQAQGLVHNFNLNDHVGGPVGKCAGSRLGGMLRNKVEMDKCFQEELGMSINQFR